MGDRVLLRAVVGAGMVGFAGQAVGVTGGQLDAADSVPPPLDVLPARLLPIGGGMSVLSPLSRIRDGQATQVGGLLSPNS